MLNQLGRSLYAIADRVVLRSMADLAEEDRRRRDWSAIRHMDEEILRRKGLSPDLVRKGPHHWPWAAA